MEPDLPFEFVVHGTAVSLQGSAAAIAAWKGLIREAARRALPEGSWLLGEPLSVTIFIFSDGRMQGDLDNRLKLILDAMVRCIYSDDDVIDRIVAQRFERRAVLHFNSPGAALIEALEAERPTVYIRVANDVVEDLP